ncbi:MAG: RdgB/HAM1 family non-canonical purine NTP pyrophosphatase [Deltaproteobacteria bacterium]|nr:RdgB/HAM1 family non-canonical purine NTP pyrophosphatase [Deltaproteobacteria bacterium]
MKLLIASKNRGKVLEIRALLGLSLQKVVEVVTLAELPNIEQPLESGKTFAENARIKAIHYATAYKILCIADDSGLAVDALGGLPGVRSARYAGEGASDASNNAHLLHELAPFPRPWKAAFVCVATAALPNRVVAEATGKVEGEILPEGRGRDGFGYDPLFLIPSLGKTMAELSMAEKNHVSHRGCALRALIAEMKNAGLLLS